MAQQTVLLWASGNQKGFAAKRENFLIFIFLKSLTLCVDLVFVHPCQAGFVCGGRGVLIRGLLFCVISLDMRFPASGCDTTQSVSAYQIDPPPLTFRGLVRKYHSSGTNQWQLYAFEHSQIKEIYQINGLSTCALRGLRFLSMSVKITGLSVG